MKRIVAGVVLSMALAPAAFAGDDDKSPVWAHDLLVELTYDHAEDADVAAATVEYGFAARLAPSWTLEGSAVLEPLDEAAGDSWLEGEGAYAESLLIRYATPAFGVSAGKFGPRFGSAAALAPGLYGIEIGEGYELTERLGVSGEVNLSQTLFRSLPGDHVLTGSVFTADRTALSGSLGESRPRVRLSDGGVGNTEGLESVAISLDGLQESGLGYTLGWRRLPGALAGEADETGLVAGVSHSGIAAGAYSVELLAEAARFQNADGVDGEDRTDFTASATVRREAWHLSTIVSGSQFDGLSGSDDLTRYELMIGRDIGYGLTLDGGAMLVDEAGDNATVLGLRLSWAMG